MPTPIEQRKDLLEITSDLSMMISYRKAILEQSPTMWVLIHKNSQTNNYGLEVNNSYGLQCSPDELEKIKETLRLCRLNQAPVVLKKVRKKKVVAS